MDLHTFLPLRSLAILNMFVYRHNLHAQAQRALSELEDSLTKVGDKSTKRIPSWAEKNGETGGVIGRIQRATAVLF